MKIDDVKAIAVLGAGDMGHGIAEVALIAGYKVFLRDIKQEFVDKGVGRIMESLEKLAAKGKVPAERVAEVKNGLLVPMVDLAEAVKEADIVIEAIPEIMDLKKETFKIVDENAPAHAILASNTSTMSISEIAKATKRPDKVAGLHYFNPAVIMKLVEVIRGEKTSDETMDVLFDFVIKNGKVAVRVEKDVPGFIVNRVQAPSAVLIQAAVDKGVVTPEGVDALMRKLGMPMGPFEIVDYTGVDVSYHGGSYYAQAVHPDFAPGKKLSELFEAGKLGKKTGQGFFDWSQGRPAIDLEKAATNFDPMDMMAVQINEATKIVMLGACSIADVDKAIINGSGSSMGPMTIAKGIEPADLTARLERLAKTYDKEIFKPTQMIKDGGYR